jgi:hypothetical protein
VAATIIDYIANIQLSAGSGDVAIEATQSAIVSDSRVYSRTHGIQIFIERQTVLPNNTAIRAQS